MPTPAFRDTIALAAAGAVVVSAIVVSSVLGQFDGPRAWLAVAGTAVALLLLAVRAVAPASLLALASLALIASEAATATDGSSIARGIAGLAPPAVVALAGLSITPARRTGALVAACGALLAGPVRALFFDPFLDADCLGCRHSAFAVLGNNDMAVVLAGLGGLGIAVGLALLVHGSRYRAGAAGASVAALLAIPGVPVSAEATAAALVLAAMTGAVLSVSKLRRRARLGALARAPQTAGSLGDALRRVFRDPTLGVRYGTASGDWVDSMGAPVPSMPSSRRLTRITQAIALDHDARAPVAGVLDEGVPRELLVSLEQQRLTAEAASQLHALAASRARVVRRADDERRRLERDLHDGAQQHLLALGFDVRSALASTDDPVTRDGLMRCLGHTTAALDAMRDISHGIYPPLLVLSGLTPALRAIPGVTESQVEVIGHLPASVERLAYLVVEDFARSASARIGVRGGVSGERLVLDITRAGSTPGQLIRERVSALGGTLQRRRRSWRLEVPCA